MKKHGIIPFLLFFMFSGQAQQHRKEELLGGLRTERTCFDVQHYAIDVSIDPEKKLLQGTSTIVFKIVEATRKIQLDLFENMKIDSIIFESNRKKLQYNRDYGAVFIEFEKELQKNTEEAVTVYYSGQPLEAINAPWDGGFVWKKDKNGKVFAGVAVQGTGASLWFPCKDSQSDEPDRGVSIKIAVSNELTAVSNGRLIEKKILQNGYTQWNWTVISPINAYNITVNIGDYIVIQDKLADLDLNYYVLSYNENKARTHFEEVKPMLQCFQEKFGPYPFKEDGYKLIESPYLGMEHQSAVAYGNNFQKGYAGNDMSQTGIGLLFDFIMVHESAHEWFGNSITSKDIADLWIHESFTTYSESVLIECLYGYEKAITYINGQKSLIKNNHPVIGQFGVNFKFPDSDQYFKGALFLNTLRSVINDDRLWWDLLYKFTETYKHQIIETADVIQFFNAESGMLLTPLFNQYLHYKQLPTIIFKIKNKKLYYKWKAEAAHFAMPIDIFIESKKIRLFPTSSWKQLDLKNTVFTKNNVATKQFLVNVLIK